MLYLHSSIAAYAYDGTRRVAAKFRDQYCDFKLAATAYFTRAYESGNNNNNMMPIALRVTLDKIFWLLFENELMFHLYVMFSDVCI